MRYPSFLASITNHPPISQSSVNAGEHIGEITTGWTFVEEDGSSFLNPLKSQCFSQELVTVKRTGCHALHQVPGTQLQQNDAYFIAGKEQKWDSRWPLIFSHKVVVGFFPFLMHFVKSWFWTAKYVSSYYCCLLGLLLFYVLLPLVVIDSITVLKLK